MTEVYRRFSDFEWVYQKLLLYKGFLIPFLPDKNFLANINMENENFQNERTG